MLSSTLLLTACGHYQYLEQDNSSSREHSPVNNRYSQEGVILDSDSNKHSYQAPKIASKNNKADTLPTNGTEKSLPRSKEKIFKKTTAASIKKINPPTEPSLWSNFIEVFTPEKVKPWQKSTLAKATMKPGGLTPASEKFNQKIYSSKETSRGGLGVAGGGCGCN